MYSRPLCLELSLPLSLLTENVLKPFQWTMLTLLLIARVCWWTGMLLWASFEKSNTCNCALFVGHSTVVACKEVTQDRGACQVLTV
jgi:hypothetical protein